MDTFKTLKLTQDHGVRIRLEKIPDTPDNHPYFYIVRESDGEHLSADENIKHVYWVQYDEPLEGCEDEDCPGEREYFTLEKDTNLLITVDGFYVATIDDTEYFMCEYDPDSMYQVHGQNDCEYFQKLHLTSLTCEIYDDKFYS